MTLNSHKPAHTTHVASSALTSLISVPGMPPNQAQPTHCQPPTLQK